MKTLIERYENFPGEHCGSVAMRGLLQHYCGLSLPEAAVFGLGAGAASVFLSGPEMDPRTVLFGRSVKMEFDLGRHLGVDYREQAEPDDQLAWEQVREEVRAGRPTMLSGDIFYLDYRDYKVHFPSHRFVLLGFDEPAGQCFIADRIRPEPETCSLGALRLSRNPPEGMSTQNLWGRFHGTEVGSELVSAARNAIAQCAETMVGDAATRADAGPQTSESARVVVGVEAVRAFAEDIRGWSARSDAPWLASFNASCLEKFGNGGGNFRRLYAAFLLWARDLDERLVPKGAPGMAVAAADAWTETSNSLFAASREDAKDHHWADAAAHAERAAEIEAQLFGQLAGA